MIEGRGTGELPYLFYKNASELIHGYDGSMPFHLYLKERFRENKNWGSKDRKRYRACCYHFWRNAVGVSRNNADVILSYLKTHFPADITHQQPESEIPPYGPFSTHLSTPLSAELLSPWFQTEPCVWIRALNNKEKQVHKALEQQQIEILAHQGPSFAVSSQADLQTILDAGIAYIQDIGSQEAMDWSDLEMASFCTKDHSIWDCCAGAGGKSLTLLQNYPNAQIHCSDVRKNILENLQKRFQSLQLKAPQTQVLDLSQEKSRQSYHVVVADVPCSGSGTWRRNPENLHFFTQGEINVYAHRQQTILNHLSDSVLTGGYLVYLTCSVFHAENESNIAMFIEKHPEYHCIEQKFCGGNENNGDFIYRAVLQRLR